MMIQNPFRTSFGVLAGIDFCGKSGLDERIKKVLGLYHPSLSVVYSKEPDINRPSGAAVYQILQGKHHQYSLEQISASHFQTFYIEDRMINYRVNILPALFNGKHVIQDRGAACSFAYGAASPNDFPDFMGMHERIFSAAEMPFIWPNYTIVVDVPVGVSLARAESANRLKDKFETEEKLERARLNYLAFAKMYPNCHVINGEQPEGDVFKDAKKIVWPALGLDPEAP